MDRDFRSAFCAHFRCEEKDYERRALLKVLHRRSLPLAWIILKIAPSYFESDFQILRHFGSLTRRSNFYADALEVRNDYRRLQSATWIRRLFKLRISGQRLLKVAAEIWRGTSEDSENSEKEALR